MDVAADEKKFLLIPLPVLLFFFFLRKFIYLCFSLFTLFFFLIFAELNCPDNS